MGKRKEELSLFERMADIIKAAGGMAAVNEIASACDRDRSHVSSEIRRQIVLEKMHIRCVDHSTRKSRYLYALGKAEPGFVPFAVNARGSAATRVEAEPRFGRFASVWAYAEGRTV